MNVIDGMACATPGCDNRGRPGLNIVGYGSFATKAGRRRRYRCTVCKGTLSTNTGTAYSGLRCTRREFNQVVSLRVEGVSIAATARVTGRSRNTLARWLERASTAAERFNRWRLRDFDVLELQADELCTFVDDKSRTRWLFAVLEVSSRLWAGSLLGRRSARNTKIVINDVATRLQDALWASEDSETLNTSFVERLNLTIRQGSAYLRRRSPCHARGEAQLRGHIALVQCYYNFLRPHRALRFGDETRTPAMQAGLVSTQLTWCDIFAAGGSTVVLVAVVVDVSMTVWRGKSHGAALLTRGLWSVRQRAA